MNMETVEHFAKIALVTHMLGKQQPLADHHVDKLREIRTKYLARKPRHRAGQRLASVSTPAAGLPGPKSARRFSLSRASLHPKICAGQTLSGIGHFNP